MVRLPKRSLRTPKNGAASVPRNCSEPKRVSISTDPVLTRTYQARMRFSISTAHEVRRSAGNWKRKLRTRNAAIKRAAAPPCADRHDTPADPRRSDGEGYLGVTELAHEAPDVAEVLVALAVKREPRLGGVDAGPPQGILGEQEVAPAGHAVLEQPVREHDVRARRLAPVADHLAEEAAVVGHDLEIQVAHAAARLAVAAVVRLELALTGPEGHERVLQPVEQAGGRPHRAVGAEREDRVPLDLLDLQGRGEPTHDLAQQLGDHRRAVLQLGGRDELREPRDVRQHQDPVFGMALHAHETPQAGGRESAPATSSRRKP